MHEKRNLFLFLMKINNMHRTRHILPIPMTLFGTGAVFRDIRIYQYKVNVYTRLNVI